MDLVTDLTPKAQQRSITMTDSNGRSGLSVAAIANAKPREKSYKLSDRDGLYLLVKPSGARYWRMNYRFHQFQRTVTFGRYPEVMLAEARQRLLEARRLLAEGIDPADQARLDKMTASIAATNTFKAVADDWLEKVRLEDRAKASIQKYEWQLGLVMPTLGNRPISQITAYEVLMALKKIERTKKFYTATSTRATCSQVFRFAIATARAERDVCADLRGALVTPKGTTGTGDCIELTRREVEFARVNEANMALAVVSRVELDCGGDGVIARGGELTMRYPWAPDPAALRVIAYTCDLGAAV